MAHNIGTDFAGISNNNMQVIVRNKFFVRFHQKQDFYNLSIQHEKSIENLIYTQYYNCYN